MAQQTLGCEPLHEMKNSASCDIQRPVSLVEFVDDS
jgi:hypothetical protein